jgi:hypothetical protein
MEVITIESKAFRQLMDKLDALTEHVHSMERPAEKEDAKWVDSGEVCRFLKISERTLQRLRTNGKITHTSLGGKYYYQIGEIKNCWHCTSSKVPTSVWRIWSGIGGSWKFLAIFAKIATNDEPRRNSYLPNPGRENRVECQCRQ